MIQISLDKLKISLAIMQIKGLESELEALQINRADCRGSGDVVTQLSELAQVTVETKNNLLALLRGTEECLNNYAVTMTTADESIAADLTGGETK